MKKISLILSAFVIVFISCETEFDVNAQWKETAVVYGLLDAGVDTQYIRINKAYLGEGDALLMAQHPDSLNFSPADLEVRLHKLGFNDTLESRLLVDTVFYKEDGLFAVENNLIYIDVSPVNFLNENHRYALTIDNIKSGNRVYSNTEVISDFDFKNFNNQSNSQYKFGFYRDDPPGLYDDNVRSNTVEWQSSENGDIYQLALKFNYTENGILKSLIWNQAVVSELPYETEFEGANFWNFLRQNLSDDDALLRQFVGIDLIMTVGTENLNNYIKINEPTTGIVQQRPQFTNINNGLGIFSSRYTYVEYNCGLSFDSYLYLTDNIEFGTGGLDRNFQ